MATDLFPNKRFIDMSTFRKNGNASRNKFSSAVGDKLAILNEPISLSRDQCLQVSKDIVCSFLFASFVLLLSSSDDGDVCLGVFRGEFFSFGELFFWFFSFSGIFFWFFSFWGIFFWLFCRFFGDATLAF